MPAPSFLKGLPKPALFGLYGAVGGLLGAVLLGEPLWHLLKPASPPSVPEEPPPPPPRVGVSASAAVQLYPGTDNTFPVQVARAEFDGPVTVTFETVPGVAIPDVIVPAGMTEATATVTAAAGAKPGTTKATATASGAGGKATATAALDVTVVPLPPPPPRLAVGVPPRLSVYRTGMCKFTVQVARAGFDGSVVVRFDPVPDGVTVPDVAIPAGETKADVTLSAKYTAALGAAPLGATATAVTANADLKDASQAEVTVLAAPTAPVDIVFVLDISGSMRQAIVGTRDGIQRFAEELGNRQLDARLGLVGFRDTTLGQPNTILKFENGEPFTTDTARFKAEVGKLEARGGGAAGESSLDGLADGVAYPFREGATRVLVLVTDEPPKNPDKRVKNVGEAAALVKQATIDQLHLVVYPQLRPMFEPLWKGAKGEFFDLRGVMADPDGFTRLMPVLGRAIAKTITVKPVEAAVAKAPPPPVIPAAAAPAPTTAAAPPPPVLAPPTPAVASLQSAETFAAGSETRLVAATGAWTGAVAAVVCLVLVAGQHHYLRGSLPSVGPAAAGFGGGFAAGVLGGACGSGLFLLSPGGAGWDAAFRVLGWVLLGGLAGTGLSLPIPNMRWVQGLAGGALGGAAGAAGYLTVGMLTGDLVGRVVGGLLLGLGIGLMVAVVEAAFRRAWLEVRYGARETITVNLGPEPVKVGGDAKACTVWARGAPDVALQFFVRDGQVVCGDRVMRREVTAADGYAKEVGNVTVTVRTGPEGSPAPVPVNRGLTPPARQEAPLSLDDPDFDPLPVAANPPPPTPLPPPLAAQPAASKPTPPAPSPPAAAKHPDACPGCGRVNGGAKGSRYCVVCDRTY